MSQPASNQPRVLYALLLVGYLAACQPGAATSTDKSAASHAEGVTSKPTAGTHQQTAGLETNGSQRQRPISATDLDPNALDEALRQALTDLRNRFRCNSVSGCRAHRVLVEFGEHARPLLQRMFATAPAKTQWRARIVRIVAEMQTPASRPFLRKVLRDNSDKARAYAVFGLALLHDDRDLEMMHNYANAPGIIASAMTRVAAAWSLAYLGDATYRARFESLVREAANHQLGGATLRWALALCRVPHSLSCDAMLPLAARHPSYIVRREVLRSVTDSLPSSRALVMLAADPNVNLARRAEAALQRRSGRGDLHGVVAWQAWLRVATERQGQAARPATAP